MRKFEENYAVKLLELCRQTICVYFLRKIFGLFLDLHYLCNHYRRSIVNDGAQAYPLE